MICGRKAEAATTLLIVEHKRNAENSIAEFVWRIVTQVEHLTCDYSTIDLRENVLGFVMSGRLQQCPHKLMAKSHIVGTNDACFRKPISFRAYTCKRGVIRR